MKATHQTRLRNGAAAIAVVLLHALAIRALLDMRALFDRLSEASHPTAMTWILLPPQSVLANPQAAPSRLMPGLPMQKLIDENANPAMSAQPAMKLLPLIPSLALPSLVPQPGFARLASGLAADLVCSFANFDQLTDAERARCALRLSNLGDIAALPGDYIDRTDTPFTVFGAHGTFAIAQPALQPFDLLASSMGCAWEQGLCRRPEPKKFGLDPDDQTRLSAVAHFDLGNGFSLDAGAQGYMENYLGGARPILTAGIALTYRW